MNILVDMDEVIASFYGGLNDGLDAYGEMAVGIKRGHEYTNWDMMDGHTPAQRVILRSVMSRPGLFAELKPIPGALAALYEMEAAGHKVHIVTSPMSTNPTCASDKLEWVTRYLGDAWRKRVIITDDKTLVRGDVLFDDKGDITGSMVPMWKQVLVDQPHNQAASPALPRVASLAHWQAAIEELGRSRVYLTGSVPA